MEGRVLEKLQRFDFEKNVDGFENFSVSGIQKVQRDGIGVRW